MSKKTRVLNLAAEETAVVTPRVADAPVEVEGSDGKSFWKHILPTGTITHPSTGKPVVFDEAYHRDVIAGSNVMDGGVPIVAVDGQNQHNWDPANYQGRVSKLAMAGEDGAPDDKPGLWGRFDFATRKAARQVRRNPNLGVSGTIAENWTEADGRSAKRALLQVATTLHPRVGGLAGFRPISLSAEAGPVLDLSDVPFTAEELPVGKKLDALDLSAETEISDEEIAAAMDEAADELNLSADEPVVESVDETTRRANILNLASVTDAQNRLAVLEAELAQSKWQNKRDGFSHRGVPKAFLDLAATVMASPTSTVMNLSAADGVKAVDARRVIEDMLELAATTEGMHVELSARAYGSPFAADSEDTVSYEDVAAQWADNGSL